MNIINLSCSSCGAPIEVDSETEFFRCPYCSTRLQIQQSGDRISVKMGQEVSRSIEHGAEITKTELKRLQLGQDLSMLQFQLSTLQAEIRALGRQTQTRQVREQLTDLKNQEMNLIGRIKSIQNSLSSDDEYSNQSRRQYYPDTRAKESVIAPTITKPKNWVAAYVLCFFLGFLGAHRFYTGHILLGIIQLVTIGGFLIWWFIDLFLIAFGKFKDSKGNSLSGPQSDTSRYIAIGISVIWALYFLFNVLG